MPEITLPNDWQPLPHQMPLWQALESGARRAVAVWHRRAGKDSLALNWTAVAALQRVGNYWHCLPEQAQARKAVWDAIDRQGRKIIDQAFPMAIRKRTLDQSMFIEFINGSTFQLIGSDNFNSLVGSNPIQICFSEFSISDPSAWHFLRPILAENGGTAIFLYTARGRNHGYDLYKAAQANPDTWFSELLTVDDTGVIPPTIIEEERKAGMAEEMIRQEFYCSFEAAIVGAYYGKEMLNADTSGRICNLPHDPSVPVETWWDLGVGDTTAIWFVQRVHREIRLIDFYETSGEGLPHYAQVLQTKGFVYSRHIAPHDIEVRELATGKSRREAAKKLGITFQVAPRLSVDDGINAVRQLLPLCWFDETKCARGIEALRMYRRKWDEKNKVFQDFPLHDFASHPSDAFRMGAVMPDVLPKRSFPKFEPRFSSAPRPGSWMGL